MMENKLYAELDRAANRIKVLEAALNAALSQLLDDFAEAAAQNKDQAWIDSIDQAISACDSVLGSE
jgi:hypothetical protein